jgi:predicted DNA-binding transcriptional regulator AlpA
MNTKYSARSKTHKSIISAKETVTSANQSNKLLSPEQVSVLIGKSEAWLARKRWEGNGIPYRKIGRHVRYHENMVMDWLNQQPILTSTSDMKK